MRTAAEVIARTGVANLPNYFGLGEMTDCAGFFVRRLYPSDSDLARVVTRSGEAVLSCLIQFIVEPPRAHGGTSRVLLRAWMYDPATQLTGWRWPPREPDFDDPRSPTPNSLALFRRSRHPLALDSLDDYVYDSAEDVFRDQNGRRVAAEQMLEFVFDYHCRTYGRNYSWRRRISGLAPRVVQGFVWNGQEVCLFLLLTLHDTELMSQRDRKSMSPFHKYQWSDFRRVQDAAGRSTFFGLEATRKSLFTNLIALTLAVCIAYLTLPRRGLLLAVYNNTALTTAALVVAFVAVDKLIPWSLIGAICLLSSLRAALMLPKQRVRA